MAYIRKLTSGKYQVQIRQSGLKTISKTFPRKKDASLFAAQVEADHKLAQSLGNPLTSKITLAILVDDFLKQYNKKDTDINTRLNWWKTNYGSVTLNQFSKSHVVAGINILIKLGSNPEKPRPLKPQTTNRFKANLSSVFTWAIEQDTYGIDINPCRLVKNKPEGKGRKRTFTETERKNFLEACQKSPWDKLYLFALLAFTSGARRGEMLKLRWSGIDFKEKQAFCGDTKNGDDKILYLIPAVVDELNKYREIGNGFIFAGYQEGTIIDYRDFWNKAMLDAGIQEFDDRYGEKLVLHSTRHTFCTSLHKAGKDLKTIQSLAGHKSINTTLRYTHDDEKLKAKAVDDVFGSLGGVK